MSSVRPWWQDAVFYQVYPRSFQDSNGDGVGDIPGLIQRLDYLNDGTERSLGIDAIWLSPTFPSPMKDFGYDVSDYRGVDPLFGSMDDMDRLIAECHGRGIRLLLDFVPNHTSDRHHWFVESRSSRDNPRRDWYYWRPPGPGGSLPNNWTAIFGGPAWTLDERTGEYYLHSFLPSQPDLNWRNPDVEAAMHDVLRFWFGRGIDGFRIDVVGRILKHPTLADDPGHERRPGDPLRSPNHNHPDVFDAVRRLRTVFDEAGDRLSVGEVFGNAREIARYYGDDALDGLHLAFNFGFIAFERQFNAGEDGGFTPWRADALAHVLEASTRALPGGALPCWAFNNHDRPRFVSRVDADGLGYVRARAAALLLLALPGVPFIYYGEELGMPNVPIPEDQLQDPARFHIEGRDPFRSPMQWDATPGRGFTNGDPWLPFGPAELSVAMQDADPHSLLNLYRRAIHSRKASPALSHGSCQDVTAGHDILSFVREADDERVLVAVNTANEPRALAIRAGGWKCLVSTHRDASPLEGSTLTLLPLEAAWLLSSSDAS